MAAFKAAYGAEANTLPAVTNGKVYVFNNKLARSTDNSISTDWFESAVSRPDLVSGVDLLSFGWVSSVEAFFCKKYCVRCGVWLTGRHRRALTSLLSNATLVVANMLTCNTYSTNCCTCLGMPPVGRVKCF